MNLKRIQARNLPSLKNVATMKLETLLKKLGIGPERTHNGQRAFNIGRMDCWQIQSLFEKAKRVYLRMIKSVYPYRHGQSCESASVLNALWRRIEELFRRKGAEV
jgi:hypothetical protein